MPYTAETKLFNGEIRKLAIGTCCAMTALFAMFHFHSNSEKEGFDNNITLFNKAVDAYIENDSKANLTALKNTVYKAYNDYRFVEPNENGNWINAISEAQFKLAKKEKWLALNELYDLDFDLRVENMGFPKTYYSLKFKPTEQAKLIIGKDYPSSPFNETFDSINLIKNNWLIDKAYEAQKAGKINTSYHLLVEQANFSKRGFLNAYELAEFYGCSDLMIILSGLSVTDYSGDIRFYGSPLPASEITLSNIEIEKARGELRKGVLPHIHHSCPLAKDY